MDCPYYYTSKAEIYARYRWDYAPQAIQTILETARITFDSNVADIGAGTGILTRHFTPVAGRVFAVEPDPEMRRLAVKALADVPGFLALAGNSESTGLASHSIDLVTVGQALHWFDPEPARREFTRILRPQGWLAVMRNAPCAQPYSQALCQMFTAAYGWDTSPGQRPVGKPPAFYFGHESFLQFSFPQNCQETWEEFFGALCSDSHAPEPDHPRFANFFQAAQELFDRYNQEGLLEVSYTTELCLGQMQCQPSSS